MPGTPDLGLTSHPKDGVAVGSVSNDCTRAGIVPGTLEFGRHTSASVTLKRATLALSYPATF